MSESNLVRRRNPDAHHEIDTDALTGPWSVVTSKPFTRVGAHAHAGHLLIDLQSTNGKMKIQRDDIAMHRCRPPERNVPFFGCGRPNQFYLRAGDPQNVWKVEGELKRSRILPRRIGLSLLLRSGFDMLDETLAEDRDAVLGGAARIRAGEEA